MSEITVNGRMTVKELKEVFFNAFEGVLRIYKGRSSAPDDATLASVSANSNIEDKELVCKDTQTVSEFVEQIKQILGVGLKVATKDDWVVVLDYIRLSQIKDIPKKATLDSMKSNFPESAQTKEEKVEKAETTKVEPAPVAPKAEKDDLMDMLERYLSTIENEKDKKSLAEFIARERKQRHFDANSEENSKEAWDTNNKLRNFVYDEPWAKHTLEQYTALYKAAQRGNVIAQYKWGSIMMNLSLFKHNFDCKKEYGWGESRYTKEDIWNWFVDEDDNYDISHVSENATKWLTKAAENGLGIAMYFLCNHLLNGPQYNIKDAVYWAEKYLEVSHEAKTINDVLNHFEIFSKVTERYYCHSQSEILRLENELEKLRSGQIINYGEKIKKLEQAVEAYKEATNKWKEAYKDLESKYDNLVRRWNNKLDECEELEEKLSQSRSSARPSADDIVKVRVMYLKKRTIGWNTRETKIVEMTRRDYKSLSEGSMKNRIAYVNNKFRDSWNIDGLEEVHVELV